MPSRPVHRAALLSTSSYGKSASTLTYLTDHQVNNNQAHSTKIPMKALNTAQDSTFNLSIPKRRKLANNVEKNQPTVPVVWGSSLGCKSAPFSSSSSHLLPLAFFICLLPSYQSLIPTLVLPTLCTGSTSLLAKRFMWMMLVGLL